MLQLLVPGGLGSVLVLLEEQQESIALDVDGAEVSSCKSEVYGSRTKGATFIFLLFSLISRSSGSNFVCIRRSYLKLESKSVSIRLARDELVNISHVTGDSARCSSLICRDPPRTRA